MVGVLNWKKGSFKTKSVGKVTMPSFEMNSNFLARAESWTKLIKLIKLIAMKTHLKKMLRPPKTHSQPSRANGGVPVQAACHPGARH